MGPKASFHINLTKNRFGAVIVTVKLRELLTAKIFLVKKKTKQNNISLNSLVWIRVSFDSGAGSTSRQEEWVRYAGGSYNPSWHKWAHFQANFNILTLTLTPNPTKSPSPQAYISLIYKPTQNPLKKLYNSGAHNWDFIVHRLMLFALPFWKVRIALGYETCFFLFHLPTC